MYSDSLREWGEKLQEEDVCSKIMSVSENKDEMLKRYNMCKSLNVMEQEFQTQLMKHAGALLKLMNKLQDMVHCSEDLREVIEKAATPDILHVRKSKNLLEGFQLKMRPLQSSHQPPRSPRNL